MKKFLCLLSIAVMLVTFLTPNTTLAKDVEDFQKEIDNSVNSVMNNTMYVEENKEEISKSEEESLENEARALLKSGKVKPESFEDVLSYKGTVQGVRYDDEVEYSVSFKSVKMNNEDVVEDVRFLNIVFSEDKTFKSVFELRGNMDENHIVTSKFWIDGQLFNSIEKDLSEEVRAYENASTEEILSSFNEERESQGLSTVGKDKSDDQMMTAAGLGERWDCTQSCVASKGVSMLAFGAIVAACGVACTAGVPATAGTACYACVNSAGILGATTILNCFEDCR
ncbi:hypothetical protein [Terribacillus saccharophilus]|uniref:hypothetical protein n=1 Tax=Terribacillus saccharophilus TaxID=361277 RepID=UPI000C9A0A87|nr:MULTISPECIES: hypothetical protein [Terribacillus]